MEQSFGDHDWQHWLKPLNFDFQHIAASHSYPDVCFSKRFVRRADLQEMTLPGWSIEVPEVLQGYTPHEDDVIMCAKQYWSDSQLAQPPMLVLPHDLLEKLEKGGPKTTAARKKLDILTLGQFRRAADKFEAKPWKYNNAASYIRKWADQNELQAWPEAAPLGWIVEEVLEHGKNMWTEEVHDDWRAYAPQAAKIEVVRCRPRHMEESHDDEIDDGWDDDDG